MREIVNYCQDYVINLLHTRSQLDQLSILTLNLPQLSITHLVYHFCQWTMSRH
jgi:hypothetical protein